MEMMTKHWTANSADGFAYRISSDFVLQLEKKMEGVLSQNDLAKRLGVSKGRVSQVLNNPGNLTLKKMVQYSRALGMKVAVLAYEDGDPTNQNGPVNAELFYRCWQKYGSPTDFFSLNEISMPTKKVCAIRINYLTVFERKVAVTANRYDITLKPLSSGQETASTSATISILAMQGA
jgi:transcriptional regulator with XRE-family HTH domain